MSIASPSAQKPRFFISEFFVSHTLPDTDYCRQLVLPAIKAVVDRSFNQCVFMNLRNFGSWSEGDKGNAAAFAAGYSKEIERLLGDSRFMLIVSSLAAAQSEWVRFEVNWWLAKRSVNEVFILHREIEPTWLNAATTGCRSLTLQDSAIAESATRLKAALQGMLRDGMTRSCDT